MLEFFLPYAIGVALEINPHDGTDMADVASDTVVLPEMDGGSGDEVADRMPEEQIPTGKFTTATEVRPILGMTKSNWVAVRDYEGQDLVYFTHLLSWRCGLWDIRYGLNGAPATQVFPMEPCHADTASPNAMTDVANFLPYETFPSGHVTSIYVEIVMDDGTTDFAQFDRNEVLIP